MKEKRVNFVPSAENPDELKMCVSWLATQLGFGALMFLLASVLLLERSPLSPQEL